MFLSYSSTPFRFFSDRSSIHTEICILIFPWSRCISTVQIFLNVPPKSTVKSSVSAFFIYLFIFKFNFFIDSLLVSRPTPQFCSAFRHPISSTHPCSTAPKKKTKQSKQENNQTKTRIKQQQNFLASPFPSLQYLFIHPGIIGDLGVTQYTLLSISFPNRCSLQ